MNPDSGESMNQTSDCGRATPPSARQIAARGVEPLARSGRGARLRSSQGRRSSLTPEAAQNAPVSWGAGLVVARA